MFYIDMYHISHMIFGEFVMEVAWWTHPGKVNEAFDITLGRHWNVSGLVLREGTSVLWDNTCIYISVVSVIAFWVMRVIELSRSMVLFLSKHCRERRDMFQTERCKHILIAYIHNGDCCYELWYFWELRKIASLMTLQHAACHTEAPQLQCFHSMRHQSFASFMTLTIKSEEVLLLCDHELDVSDIDVCVWCLFRVCWSLISLILCPRQSSEKDLKSNEEAFPLKRPPLECEKKRQAPEVVGEVDGWICIRKYLYIHIYVYIHVSWKTFICCMHRLFPLAWAVRTHFPGMLLLPQLLLTRCAGLRQGILPCAFHIFFDVGLDPAFAWTSSFLGCAPTGADLTALDSWWRGRGDKFELDGSGGPGQRPSRSTIRNPGGDRPTREAWNFLGPRYRETPDGGSWWTGREAWPESGWALHQIGQEKVQPDYF